MASIAEDSRIDPRIKAMFGSFALPALPSVASREELLAQENSEAALAATAGLKAFLDAMGTEEAAPSTGLSIRTERFASSPDGNTVNIQFIQCTFDIRCWTLLTSMCGSLQSKSLCSLVDVLEKFRRERAFTGIEPDTNYLATLETGLDIVEFVRRETFSCW